MTSKLKISELSYGISTPQDLLNKLLRDAEKAQNTHHPDDLFNFFITVAALREWVIELYPKDLWKINFLAEILAALESTKRHKDELINLPEGVSDWINNHELLSNLNINFTFHITCMIDLCHATYNASKHIEWRLNRIPESFESQANIDGWYQYYTTPLDQEDEDNLFINYQGHKYTFRQLAIVLPQFYTGLINYIEKIDVS